jgi:tetratricopeptide (TPR) repeat protein
MKIRFAPVELAARFATRLMLLVGMVWLAGVARAQDNEDEGGDDESTYSYAFLLRDRHTTLKSNGEKIVREHRRLRVLKPQAVERLGEVIIPYNGYRADAKFVRGSTILPDGRELQVDRDAVRDAEDASVSDYLMYEDVRQLSFSMPGVKVGAILDYEVEIRHHRPTLKGESWDSFQIDSGVPVHEARYVVVAPKKVDLRIRQRHTDVKPTEDKGFFSITRTWVFKDVPSFRYEPGMPPLADSRMAIEVSTLQSWQTVQDWYADHTKDAFELDDAIRAKVDEITAGKTSDLEKIRALYLFLQKDIRYVGIELGMSAYRPHPATDCFRNRYGDCKDQSVLLAAMLRHVGIDAYLALVSSGAGTVDRELPDLGQFNHVIVYVPRPAGVLWLDSTVKYMDEQSHPYQLDGADALIIGAKGVQFETIQPPPPERSYERTVFEVNLMANGYCRVKEILEYTGRAGASSRVEYENVDPKRRKENVEKYVNGKGAVLISYGNSDPHDLANPFREWVVYESSNFMADTADGYTLNLSAERVAWLLSLPKPRKRPGEDEAVRHQPWSNRYSFSEGLACILHLPTGVHAGDVPPPYDIKLPQGELTLSAKVDGQTVELAVRAARVPCVIPAAKYEENRLRTHRALARASLTMAFVDEVKQLLGKEKVEEARALATKQVAENPKSPESHLVLASVCFEIGRYVQARHELREAIRLDPKRLDPYQRLAMTFAPPQGFPGKGVDRENFLKVANEAVANARDRAGAQYFLAAFLERDEDGQRRGKGMKNLDGAIAVYRQMLQERPDELEPLSRIAECHFSLGEFDKAEACFNQILAKEPDNDGAKAGQWVCAACLGRADEAIGAIRTAYDSKKERAQELGRVSGFLLQQRKYGALLKFMDSRLALLEDKDQSLEGYRILLGKVAKTKPVDYGTYFDLASPEGALTTFLSAMFSGDQKRLHKSLSPRLAFSRGDERKLLEAGNALGDVMGSDFALDMARSLWIYKQTPMPGGLVRLDASMPPEFAGAVGRGRAARMAILAEKDAEGLWRICGFGRPEPMPDNLARVALSYLKAGNADLAKQYAEMVRKGFLQGRSLFSEPTLHTELADLKYPDDETFVKAMVAASMQRQNLASPREEATPLRFARELAQKLPDADPVQRLLAEHLRASEHYGQALAILDNLSKKDPKDRRLIVERIFTLRKLYRYRDALQVADQLAALMPSADAANNIKLDVLIEAGQAKEGLALLKELAPRWEPKRVQSKEIRLRAMSGDRAGVLKLFGEMTKGKDADSIPLTSLALSLRHVGLQRKSLELSELACRTGASDTGLIGLCEQFLFTGDFDEARDVFDRLYRTGEMEGLDAHYLGCLGLGLDRYEESENLFSTSLEGLDVDSNTYAELFIGVSRVLRGKTKEGLEAIHRANDWQYDDIWPKPVLQYFAGKATLDDMVAVAKQADTDVRRGQFLCEAYFYAAIKARMDGNEEQFRALLRKSTETRSFLTMECAISHGLLGVPVKEE